MARIIYNGKTTEVPAGKLATCLCRNKAMKGNLVVEAGDTFTILGYTSSRHIEDGKTATLQCDEIIARTDITVDTRYCKIIVYGQDDTTELGSFLTFPDVKVTVESADLGVTLQFTVGGTDVLDRIVTYQYDNELLSGITDDINYYRGKYKKGDSFVLSGHKSHKLYLRGHATKYSSNASVWFYGLGYVDGVDYWLPTGTANWVEWINNDKCNKLGAQIINGHIYTSDGTKILFDSYDVKVESTSAPVAGGEYTFKSV